jgi:hypothetical protein
MKVSRNKLAARSLALGVSLLLLSSIVHGAGRGPLHLSEEDLFLDGLAQDTWAYLSSDWATVHHLPWSWRSATISGGDYANTAEIGLYALAWLAAYDLQRPWSPSWAEAEEEVSAVLDRLRAWQTGSQTYQPHGPNAYGASVFYQWYWISWDPPVVGDGAGNHVVPSIDNAWLAASLITIRAYTQANSHAALAPNASLHLGSDGGSAGGRGG